MAFSLIKSNQTIYEKVKYFQNLTFHINNQILQFWFKCIHLQIMQVIKNPLISKFITSFWHVHMINCKVFPTNQCHQLWLQDITNDNQGEYFPHYFANCPSLWRKYDFAMQQIVDCNIMWWLIKMSPNIGTRSKKSTRSIL
jgi:hypothetical protein